MNHEEKVQKRLFQRSETQLKASSYLIKVKSEHLRVVNRKTVGTSKCFCDTKVEFVFRFIINLLQ